MREGGCVRVSRSNFNKIYVPLELLATFNHSIPLIHESRMSFSCFFLSHESLPSLRVTHKLFAPSLDCEVIGPLLCRNRVSFKKNVPFYFPYCEAESGNTLVKEVLRKTVAQVARGRIHIHLSLSVV